MAGRFPSRFHLALLGLIALATLQIHAQTSGIFLCTGSASTNFQLADYQACPKPNATTALSFSFGASLPVTSSGGTVTVGQTSVSQFTIQKSIDRTTTRWATSVYSNTPIAPVLAIGINYAGGPSGNVNVTIKLTNPRVIQFGHSGSSDIPTETISLSYDSITVYDNSTSPAKVVKWTGL